MATDISHQIRRFWDDDAATYDRSPSHHPHQPEELAAWRAALRRLLPAPPARVLDAGAGTGFLSLLLARQGYQVTAVDLSERMLAALRSKAGGLGLEVRTVHADAAQPPAGENFDAVVERHLLWTLPEPGAALAAWRAAAPAGRLVLIEGTWGTASGADAIRARARKLARLIRRPEPDHHDHYPAQVTRALPYANGLRPADAIRLVEDSPWGAARFERLADVEWATVSGRGMLAGLLGTAPRWAVIAGS